MSYEEYYPYQAFYFDSYYFTPFEGQNIYQPWFYYFNSPELNYYHRRTQTIVLGRTYDSISSSSDDINFTTVTNDINSNVANFINGVNRTATVNLNVNSSVCADPGTSFNIVVSFDLPQYAISVYDSPRSSISHNDRQQFTYLPPFSFDEVYYTAHTAKMLIKVRQIDASRPNNYFTVKISGGLSGGRGSYNGSGRVAFVCQ